MNTNIEVKITTSTELRTRHDEARHRVSPPCPRTPTRCRARARLRPGANDRVGPETHRVVTISNGDHIRRRALCRPRRSLSQLCRYVVHELVVAVVLVVGDELPDPRIVDLVVVAPARGGRTSGVGTPAPLDAALHRRERVRNALPRHSP